MKWSILRVVIILGFFENLMTFINSQPVHSYKVIITGACLNSLQINIGLCGGSRINWSFCMYGLTLKNTIAKCNSEVAKCNSEVTLSIVKNINNINAFVIPFIYIFVTNCSENWISLWFFSLVYHFQAFWFKTM